MKFFLHSMGLGGVFNLRLEHATMRDWNRVLNKLTDEILAVKEKDTP
ncbi:MAG: hypothetical protein WA383_21405 [Terriglobales bacterium]